MKRRGRLTITIAVGLFLLLQQGGCLLTLSGYLIGCGMETSEPTLYTVTPTGIDSIPPGQELTVLLKNGSRIEVTFGGADFVQRIVYLVWPADLGDVTDTLENWRPIDGEPIVIYRYPSDSIFFQGRTDYDKWNHVLRSEKRKLEYMTPQVSRMPLLLFQAEEAQSQEALLWAERRGDAPYTVAVPSDSIAEMRSQNGHKNGRWIGAAVGFGADLVIVTIAMILWSSDNWLSSN
jgi:hypothetical protein